MSPMRYSTLGVLLTVVAGCAAAPRDAAWARRQIIESECRTWAQSQARAEYALQIQEGARLQRDSIRSGYSAGAAYGGAYSSLAQAARQARENELNEACMIERGLR